MRDEYEHDLELPSDALMERCGEREGMGSHSEIHGEMAREDSTGSYEIADRCSHPYPDPYHDPRFARWLEQQARIKMSVRERSANACVSATFAVRLHRNIKIAHARTKIPVSELRVREADMIGTIGQVARVAAKVRCAPWFDNMAVAAGVGREMWDEPCERWVELPRGVPRSGHVAVNVAGDSMTPVLKAGDVLLVKVGASAKVGTLLVARHPDDGYVVKYVSKIETETIELESFNPSYTPFRIANDQRLIVGTVSHILRVP